MKKVIIAGILAALVVGGYATTTWMGGLRRAGDQVAADVPRVALERRTVVEEIEVIGMVQARESAIINAPFNGTISWLIPEGTFVHTGDIVAEMETEEIEQEVEEEMVELELRKSELKQAEAELELQKQQNRLDRSSEEAQVEYAKLALQDAKRKFEEQKTLVERNLASQSTLEAERLSLLQAELNLKEAEIKLRKLIENQESALITKQADLEKIRVNINRYEQRVKEEQEKLANAKVKATKDGFVSIMMTWRGRRAKIAEGDQVWSRNGIVEIPDATQMEVMVPVNELDITRVKEGQPAKIRIAAIPGEVFEATVSRKGQVPMSDISSPWETREGVKQFEVNLGFTDQDDRLRQSMTATAVVEINRAENVLSAPLDAVYTREATDEDAKEAAKRYVIVDRSGRLEEVEVKLGVSGYNFAEIKPVEEGALKEGDLLLLRDPNNPIG